MEYIGRYRIIGELGRGAMGVVYHATDPSIGRSVAIKTIRIHDINDTQQREKLRERLFREARSAGVLSHPNIVTIYDMDETDGLAYIAMAYVNGPTLEKILGRDEPLSGADMLRVLRQAASGLDYAHARGIVHRDVKPANIMTDEDGAVKIADFGIAKIAAVSNLTDTRSVVGTPNYMSPEQVQGHEVDGRSDQFSLAVIAYEILTGERPFQGEQLSTVVYKIVAQNPVDAHLINGTLTPRISAVLRRGLAKKPEDRYPHCTALVTAIEMACAESRGWQTLASGGGAAMATASINRESADIPASLADRRPKVILPPLPVREKEPVRRSSLLLPLTMSIAAVLAVASVVAWQMGFFPVGTLASGRASETARTAAPVQTAQAAEPQPTAVPDNAKIAAATAIPSGGTPPPAESAAQAEEPLPTVIPKPSPFAPVTSTAAVWNQKAPRDVLRLPSGEVEDIWVTTSPPGARALMDGDAASSCQTPCMLHAETGAHHLTITDTGYETEYRDVNVGDVAMDVPPINLRRPTGTLMLTTSPPGAAVRIDGKLIPQVTPAQIPLSPGSYLVTVEINGRSRTQRVEMQQNLTYLRLPLEE